MFDIFCPEARAKKGDYSAKDGESQKEPGPILQPSELMKKPGKSEELLRAFLITGLAAIIGGLAVHPLAADVQTNTTSGAKLNAPVQTNVAAGAPESPKNDRTASVKNKSTPPAPRTISGAELYSIHCYRCHPERYPTERTAAQWKTILMHMRVRANLPAEQARTILKYLQDNSGR